MKYFSNTYRQLTCIQACLLKSSLHLVAALVHDGAVLETRAGRIGPGIGSRRAGLPYVRHPYHDAIRPVNGADTTAAEVDARSRVDNAGSAWYPDRFQSATLTIDQIGRAHV